MDRQPAAKPAQNRSNAANKARRLHGVVRVYLREQGVGLIEYRDREFRFGITDFVGTEQPVEGDQVSFVPQLQSEQFRARRIQIEQQAEAKPLSPLEAGTRQLANARLAQEVRPDSAETVRAAKVRAPVHQYRADARQHVRCGSCQRLVIPKMVKVKSGLRSSGPRWVESCPRCKGSLDGKTSSLKMVVGATAAMIGGAVAVTRSFFF